jgi:tetratricopeptide (TPR) repeat protein
MFSWISEENEDMKIKHLILASILAAVFSSLLLAGICSAKSIAFQREYTYQASEADSKLSCRRIALEQVKRLLLEQVGTYLESQTEVKNFQLTKDQITTLTAGIVRAEPIAEKWDGKRYWLKAKIVIDPDEVAKSIDALRKDRKKTKELEELKNRAEQASREIELLRQKVDLFKGRLNPKQREVYNLAIKELEITDWFEKGNVFYTSGNYEKAIEAFTTVIRLDSENSVAYRARGYAYYHNGQYENAMADFSDAMYLNPGDSAAYHARLMATLRWYMQQWIVWAIAAAVLIPLIVLIGNHRLNKRAEDYLNEHLDEAIRSGAPDIYRELKKKEQETKNRKQIDTSLVFTLDALSQGYYDWLRVDDRAVDAIKFALGKGEHGFENIYNAASRAAGNTHALDRLKGYVGEQIAAKDLAAQGCVVSFPDSPTQEGYDLIVDGTAIQVKTTLVESHIRNALEMHPDIPVLAPTELLDTPVAAGNVIFSPNFSHQLAEDITNDSMEAITDLGIDLRIPILTVAYVGYRKIKEVCDGKDLQLAMVEGVTEVSCVTVGGTVGGAAGLTAGTAAAAAGVGGFVSWGSAAAVGGSLAAAIGGKYGAIAGGAAFLILGPLGAVAVAAAGTIGGAALGRIVAEWFMTQWKFRGHMDVVEPAVSSAQRCREVLSRGLGNRVVALQAKRSKIIDEVLVPDNKRADRILKKKLRIHFDQDEANVKSQLRALSSKLDLNLQAMRPADRIVKTHEVVESTLKSIQNNPVVSKDLAEETNELRLSAEAFYTFLKKRELIAAA